LRVPRARPGDAERLSRLLDDQALAGGQLQHLVATLGEEGILGPLLWQTAGPAVVVQDDDGAGHHAVPQNLQRADLALGIVQVDMQESDLVGGALRETGRHVTLHDVHVRHGAEALDD